MTDAITNAAPAAPALAQAPFSPPDSLVPGGAAPLSETMTSPLPTTVAPSASPDLATSAWDRISALLDAGGPVVLVLGLFSIVALAIVLLKLWQFQAMRLERLGPVEESLRRWQQSDTKGAIALVAGRVQPVAQLVHLALIELQRPSVDVALLREELARIATAQLERLRGQLRTLEVIAALSPLLGLLGTVLGMIEAFRQLEMAGRQVDPSILSGGIWEALLTTAMGLSVAIPVVLAHAWLERRVERCAHRMEDAVTLVFTRGLKAPVPSATPQQAPRTLDHAA